MQADVALIMVPADGNFTAAIAKGNPKVNKHRKVLRVLIDVFVSFSPAVGW
jgi:hypothetical protein